MKVKAFENAASATTEVETTRAGRQKRTKENMSSTAAGSNSSNTPLIGKLRSGALGRFLTPTQATNLTPNSMAVITHAKKAPSSASKAMTLPKVASASSKLKASSSTSAIGSTKTLSRENSAEEVRKGMLQMNEERKKQREQKHLLAAQQREAKERERAERIAKLTKDREEKLLAKKQAEAEQRKREQEELQRKLRLQQEAAEAEAKKKTAKMKAIMEQEREMLQQLKEPPAALAAKGAMLPPPPRGKYCFEMLHEDDSTDDEDKISHKRPPPPNWSRRNVREGSILMQQYFPSSVIDNFFSVQPMTMDLLEIFPNIDKRHLKRNSSALWATPPRYSELPKY